MQIGKIAATFLAIAGATAGAQAADLPSRKTAPAYLAPAPVTSWGGFYVGLNAGYAFSGSGNTNFVASPSPALNVNGLAMNTAHSALIPSKNSGFIGGGQIGYNFMASPSFLVGLETDIQGLAGSGSGTAINTATAPNGASNLANFTATNRLNWFGTLRGRLGYAFAPTFLGYVTGGLAYGGVSNSVTMFASNTINQSSSSFVTASGTRVGWTVGGGLEWMFAQNWSAKLEYLYYDLGTTTAIGAVTSATSPFLLATVQSTTRTNGHIVRAGVNYHFNMGGSAPVVAKY